MRVFIRFYKEALMHVIEGAKGMKRGQKRAA
jgi:hypothetical protein